MMRKEDAKLSTLIIKTSAQRSWGADKHNSTRTHTTIYTHGTQ